MFTSTPKPNSADWLITVGATGAAISTGTIGARDNIVVNGETLIGGSIERCA
jgi:hypothetical protein